MALRAVAGKVKVTTSIGLWSGTVDGDAGDLVVGTGSTLNQQRGAGNLGGAVTLDCGHLDLSVTAALLGGAVGTVLQLADLISGLTCTHVSETSDQSFLAEIFSQASHVNAVYPSDLRGLAASGVADDPPLYN